MGSLTTEGGLKMQGSYIIETTAFIGLSNGFDVCK